MTNGTNCSYEICGTGSWTNGIQSRIPLSEYAMKKAKVTHESSSIVVRRIFLGFIVVSIRNLPILQILCLISPVFDIYSRSYVIYFFLHHRTSCITHTPLPDNLSEALRTYKSEWGSSDRYISRKDCKDPRCDRGNATSCCWWASCIWSYDTAPLRVTHPWVC